MTENSIITEASNEEAQSNNEVLTNTPTEEVKIESNQEVKTDSQEAEKELEYKDFTLPEGYKLDDKVKEGFISTAKELKLSQEQAQKLVDFQTKLVQENNNKITEDFNNQVKSWREETLKEFGPKFKEEQVFIAKAMKQFGSPELNNLLNQTGLGNHKEVVKFIASVGKSYSDDKFVGGKKASGDLGAASALYPNMK